MMTVENKEQKNLLADQIRRFQVSGSGKASLNTETTEPPELETDPVSANCFSCAALVERMVVLRPPGQKTTSNPAPEGMMNVDV